mmetsp:Transcript_13930/g.32670  ORF Transcript_13930/g.32670 Transcript_13930/m.32670 type:complete len:244 (+) Transcript_13930:131-862(+)
MRHAHGACKGGRDPQRLSQSGCTLRPMTASLHTLQTRHIAHVTQAISLVPTRREIDLVDSSSCHNMERRMPTGRVEEHGLAGGNKLLQVASNTASEQLRSVLPEEEVLHCWPTFALPDRIGKLCKQPQGQAMQTPQMVQLLRASGTQKVIISLVAEFPTRISAKDWPASVEVRAAGRNIAPLMCIDLTRCVVHVHVQAESLGDLLEEASAKLVSQHLVGCCPRRACLRCKEILKGRAANYSTL